MSSLLVTYGLKRFIYTIPKLCILPNHKKGTALVLYPSRKVNVFAASYLWFETIYIHYS